jgi:phosphoribosylformylglycinamidine synthase
MMLAKIYITYKNGVLDSQGKAVHSALTDLGFSEVKHVNVGKYLEIRLAGASEADAQKRVREMCEKLLANTVIESFRYTLTPSE